MPHALRRRSLNSDPNGSNSEHRVMILKVSASTSTPAPRDDADRHARLAGPLGRPQGRSCGEGGGQ
eukprot:4726372-Alexandrium_andersonii.AAC.1